MDTIRIVVYKNNKSPGVGKNLLINSSISLEKLLDECCKALNDEFKAIFNERGIEIDSSVGLQDGSSLYLSKGEKFQAATEDSISNEPVLVLLGAAGVGKSAIALRYVRNLFVSYYDPTIEDYYKHTAAVNGETHHFSILDTAGMEDYEPLIDEWIDKKQAILLIFSVELLDSMEKLEIYYQRVTNRYKNINIPVIALVGNKIDLNNNVTQSQAKKFAEKKNINYFEVSAATGQGIKELFSYVLIEINKRRNKPRRIPWYRRCNLL